MQRFIRPKHGRFSPWTRRRAAMGRGGRLAWTYGCALLAMAAAMPVLAAEPSGQTLPPAQQVPPARQAAPAAKSYDEFPNVVYVRRGKLELKGDLYVPKGAGPFPGVLMVHGGAWKMGSKLMCTWQSRELAQRGYSVMAIDYRLAPEFKYPAQFDDCLDAIRFMRRQAARFKIDPARVGACGYSAGGHLVCMLGCDGDQPAAAPAASGAKAPAAAAPAPAPAEKSVSTRVQAVVAGGAPVDFRRIPENSDLLSYWLGGTRHEKPALYAAASPLSMVKAGDPPIFLYHGAEDHLVPKVGAIAMVAALKAQGVPTELYLVPDAGHIGAYLDQKAFVAAMAFLDKTLKPAAPADAKPLPAKNSP